MNDMHSFEQQLASSLDQLAGPRRSVDAMAISREAIATQSPKWRFQSMFSATKFVVAGAIVALFGGFLLAGVLTQQLSDEPLSPAAASPSSSPDATTPYQSVRSDILPGVDLMVEAVEPGVYRLISDGMRDVVQPPTGWGSYDDLGNEVVAGLDGSVWDFVIRGTWNGADESSGAERADCGSCLSHSYRLGDTANHEWTGELASVAAGYLNQPTQVAVGPDGTVWVIVHSNEPGASGLRSFDGTAWTRYDLEDPDQIEVLADGTVWVATALYPSEEPRLHRLGSDGWETVPVPEAFERMVVGSNGNVLHLLTEDSVWGLSASGEWMRLTGFADIWPEPEYGKDIEIDPDAVVGDDGTVWTTLDDPGPPRARNNLLARFDGSAWKIIDWPAGLKTANPHSVAPDGALWMAGHYDGNCEQGVIRFDGTTWSQYLDGYCVTSLDISPDGSAWVQAWAQAGGNNVYVITPEAVATTE